MSHPVRVRGLKLEGTWVAKYKDTVAPRAGAWVETEMYCLNLRRQLSHPVRVRGLKLTRSYGCCGRFRSHPVRVRGLKPAKRFL